MLILKLIITGIIVLGAVLFFLWSRKHAFLSKTPQTVYSVRRVKPEPIHIDHYTALEKSWVFFNIIADMVKTKFSKHDQEAILQIGVDLQNAGVEYYHLIDPIEVRKALGPDVIRGKQQKQQPGIQAR